MGFLGGFLAGVLVGFTVGRARAWRSYGQGSDGVNQGEMGFSVDPARLRVEERRTGPPRTPPAGP